LTRGEIERHDANRWKSVFVHTGVQVGLKGNVLKSLKFLTAVSALALVTLATLNTASHADTLPLGAAENYAVLYEGGGTKNFQMTSDSGVTGNVGIGGTGNVQLSSGTITGNLDFANTGNCNSNATCGGTVTGTITSNVSAVASALSTVNALNTTLGGETGANLTISGTTTINASAGTIVTVGGVMYSVFNVTSYSENNAGVVTINGITTGPDAGAVVVLNFDTTSNVNLGGSVVLSNLTADQVLWNFVGGSGLTGGPAVMLTNNKQLFQGDILDPNGSMDINGATLDGRFFGGDSADDQIVSNAFITQPPSPVPGPVAGAGIPGLVLACGGAIALARRRRRQLA
jgi:hypothetical protein